MDVMKNTLTGECYDIKRIINICEISEDHQLPDTYFVCI